MLKQLYFVMLIYCTYTHLFIGPISAMSNQSDNQNRLEEHHNLSEGTSPSRSSDDESRSTPSNPPKAATRHRKKRTSESEHEDYIADEEVTCKKKLIKK